jgi:hypothetical protein
MLALLCFIVVIFSFASRALLHLPYLASTSTPPLVYSRSLAPTRNTKPTPTPTRPPASLPFSHPTSHIPQTPTHKFTSYYPQRGHHSRTSRHPRYDSFTLHHHQHIKHPPSARLSNSLTIGSPTTLPPDTSTRIAFALKVSLSSLQYASPTPYTAFLAPSLPSQCLLTVFRVAEFASPARIFLRQCIAYLTCDYSIAFDRGNSTSHCPLFTQTYSRP